MEVRKKAVEVLTKFDMDGSIPEIRAGAGGGVPEEGQALLTSLIYGVLRNRERVDWMISSFSRLPLKKLPHKILNLLRISVYQLFFLDRVADYAVVNEAVNLVRVFKKPELASYINGMLRTMQRAEGKVEFPPIEADAALHISVCYSHPLWMTRRWIKRYGIEKTIEICKNNLEIPPLTIRVNRLKCTPGKLAEKFPGMTAPLVYSRDGLYITGRSPLASEEFAKGYFYVQDEASQLVSIIAAPQKGEKILDGCAGPGGKAFHMAEIAGGSVIAVEKDRSQAILFRENKKRLGAEQVRLLETDLMSLPATEKFDRILLDAPCSGLGVLRRRPDAKWRKEEESFSSLQERQLALLETCAKLLAPGGVIIYSTCSTEQEETWDVADQFHGFRTDSSGIPEDLMDERGAFNTTFNRNGMDYMFAVKFRSVR